MPLDAVSPVALAEQALELVRARSLRRARIDWEEVVPEFRRRATGCRSLADAHDLIRELLYRLSDGHSFLRTPDDMTNDEAPGHAGIRLHQEEPVVIDVFSGGPAARAGLRTGDRIARVGGEAVTRENWRSLRRSALLAGTPLELELGDGRIEAVVLDDGFTRPNPLPRGRVVASRLGLVDLPGHDGDGALGDGLAYGEMVAGLLHDLEAAGVQGWIIDLRRCDGGNMWPILAGLTPLLGRGDYGAFVDPVDGIDLAWGFDGRALQVVNRQDPSESYLMTEVPYWAPLRDPGAAVAVLTSAVTSSSGEAVLISFLGREDTRTFGLPTGGLTTANNLHVLMDGSWLLLAESVEADRRGRVYEGPVTPDELVRIDWRRLGTEGDPVVEAAAAWLEGDRIPRGDAAPD